MTALTDRTGLRYGRLVVLGRDTELKQTSSRTRTRWMVACDCGVKKSVASDQLASGNTVSCGCFKAYVLATSAVTHGMAKTPTYISWAGAKQRCSDPKHIAYHRYGGAGVRMCEEWVNSFEKFYAYMGEKPAGTSLDRIENAQGYEPGNCRWATVEEQSRNQSRRDFPMWKGAARPIGEVAKIEQLPRTSLNKAWRKTGDINEAIILVKGKLGKRGAQIGNQFARKHAKAVMK